MVWDLSRSQESDSFLISVLIEDTNGQSEDLYIRSVRFSPDGALLATGAEDRQIRVGLLSHRAPTLVQKLQLDLGYCQTPRH